MLFVLSNELIEFCSAPNGREIAGLQNLLQAAQDGKHAVIGSNAIFVALFKNTHLSDRERAMAKTLANRRTELRALVDIVRYKVLVEAGSISNKFQREDGFCWRISLAELSEKYLEKLVILAENMMDAEIYQWAARHYQASKRLNGFVLSSTARGGGGSTIAVELKKLLADGTPVFAITDGDLTFSGSPVSVMANRCEDLVINGAGLGWHFSLPTRDVENIVPHKILLEVADSQIGPGAFDLIELISEKNDVGISPCMFACLKKGLTLKQTFENKNIPEKNYWLNVADKIKSRRDSAFGVCFEKQNCTSACCNCFISGGFGEAVLVQVGIWLSERSVQNSLKSFSSSEIWMDIGAMTFDISIAFERARI